jgi:hypothetical protein
MEKPHRSRGKGFSDQLGGDQETPTISAARAQFLTRRGIPFNRACAVSDLVFGEARP